MFLKNNMDGDDTDNMKMRLDCNLRTILETKYSYSGAKQFSGQSALPENNSIAARFKIWLESMNEYVLECNAPYSYSSGLLRAVTQSTARELNNALLCICVPFAIILAVVQPHSSTQYC
jgi:hypothetical protein